MRAIKRWWLIGVFLSGMAFAMLAEDLVLTPRENRLEFSAPRLHFLTGRPLERMKNADPVPFDFKITLWSGTRTHEFAKSAAEFVVSYDVIEETFSVAKLTPRKATNHLTSTAAEAWCLKEMSMDISGIKESDQLWVRMEIRAQDAKDRGSLFNRGNISDSGISLMDGLIDVFSRPAQESQPHWTLDSGPITLSDLRRARGGQ